MERIAEASSRLKSEILSQLLRQSGNNSYSGHKLQFWFLHLSKGQPEGTHLTSRRSADWSSTPPWTNDRALRFQKPAAGPATELSHALVVLDLRMPGMTGVEAAWVVRTLGFAQLICTGGCYCTRGR